MTPIARRTPPCRRHRRLSLRSSTAVAALILSSCSAVKLNEEPEALWQTAQMPGQPLQLNMSADTDWVDSVTPAMIANRPLEPLLHVTPSDATDLTLDIVPVMLAEGVGAVVAAVWSGILLNTEYLEPPAVAEGAESLPLLLADGRYHWPRPEPVAESAQTPCLRTGGTDIAPVACAEWTDQIALAPTTVDDAMLADQRGGFITVGGLQIDIGIQVETLVNGITQLTTALTLDDVVNGGLEGIRIGQVTLSNGDGATDIVHNVGLGNVNTVITNSQDDLDISTFATLAIDVINLQQPQIGNSFGASGRMSPELQQSIVRGLAP